MHTELRKQMLKGPRDMEDLGVHRRMRLILNGYSAERTGIALDRDQQ